MPAHGAMANASAPAIAATIGDALWASALPFRYPAALDEVLAAFGDIQAVSQDLRRSGSAAWTLLRSPAADSMPIGNRSSTPGMLPPESS